MNKLFLMLVLVLPFREGFTQKVDDDFASLIKSFGSRVGRFYEDTINVPLIYRGEDFSVRLADSSFGFATKSVTLQNPYSDKAFPLSYSVVYDQHIISLFEPGYFACFRLADLSRNRELEKLLNKKRFKSHWIIDDKLCGLTRTGFWYLYDEGRWQRTKRLTLPVNFKSDLITDKSYIIYNDCNGEFGGTIYFYNRRSKETYFTSATCANTVIKDQLEYKILSHLGHGFGSADLKSVADPSKLPNLKSFKTKRKSIEAIGYADTSGYAKTIFDFYGIQIFSMFQMNGKTLFLIHWQDRTFLAEVNGSEILIVDPLFNSDLYTHDPITKEYPSGEVLINLDFWGTGEEREVSMLLINQNNIKKIDWNKRH